MIKISIIMPVYNCEMYLSQSINSVWKQSLYDWELLCIDDGSTDNSLEILRSFSEKDVRIKVHTQSNRGAGAARNQGLQFAKGEFVAFLDADDYYLDPDALEVMYDTCVKNKVAACGSYLHILRGEKAAQDILFAEIKKSEEKDTVYHYRDYQFDYGYYCFIYRTDVLKRSNIVFPHYRRFQDPPFFVQAMYAIDRFCFVDRALYCYRSPNVGLRFDSGKLSGLLSGILDNLIFSKEHQLQQLFDKTVKRLEWEYSDIICSNIEEKDVEILRLLLQINGVMEEVYGKEYVILPPSKAIGKCTGD